MSDRVTGDEVRQAMTEAGIDRVDHHDCGLCGYMTAYIRRSEALYFDRGCDCSWGGWEERSWDDAAEWINMQSDDQSRAKLRTAFGLPPEVPR